MKFGLIGLLLAVLVSACSGDDAATACAARFSANTCFSILNR